MGRPPRLLAVRIEGAQCRLFHVEQFDVRRVLQLRLAINHDSLRERSAARTDYRSRVGINAGSAWVGDSSLRSAMSA